MQPYQAPCQTGTTAALSRYLPDPACPRVASTLERFEHDHDAARRLGRRAAEFRARSGAEDASWIPAFEERLAAGAIDGRLGVVDRRPAGFVSWSAGNPLGVSVGLLYLEPEFAGPARYGELLDGLGAIAGAPAFVPGPLAGLTEDAEDRLMSARGYRRFGRSEMLLVGSSPALLAEPAGTDGLRPISPSDLTALAELHAQAYRGRFDRYLFLEDTDERLDATKAVQDIVQGVWGELSATGSWMLEERGRALGAVLAVRPRSGTLIADVMVDPVLQGQGVGRRVLSTSIRALWLSGERRIFLNVTEGNERALRLYRSLGFERSLGPTRDWYNAARIPVGPGP
jgi:ribosomal protein S18 acetylase RimI-like enzyme